MQDGSWSVWVYYEEYVMLSNDEVAALKMQACRARSHSPTNVRQVRLKNTGEVFPSIKDAAARYNLSTTCIGLACRGLADFGGHDSNNEKLYWEYVA